MAKQQYKVKDTKEAFGNLVFLRCDDDPVVEVTGYGRNQKTKLIGYRHLLLSDMQDDVSVITPATLGRLDYEYQTAVDLENAVLVPVGKQTRNGTYIEWEAYADNIVLKLL